MEKGINLRLVAVWGGIAAIFIGLAFFFAVSHPLAAGILGGIGILCAIGIIIDHK